MPNEKLRDLISTYKCGDISNLELAEAIESAFELKERNIQEYWIIEHESGHIEVARYQCASRPLGSKILKVREVV